MKVTYKTRSQKPGNRETSSLCGVCGGQLENSVVVEAYLFDSPKPAFGFSACHDHQSQAIEAAVKWQARWLRLKADEQRN